VNPAPLGVCGDHHLGHDNVKVIHRTVFVHNRDNNLTYRIEYISPFEDPILKKNRIQ
jgi:hypothetical protein